MRNRTVAPRLFSDNAVASRQLKQYYSSEANVRQYTIATSLFRDNINQKICPNWLKQILIFAYYLFSTSGVLHFVTLTERRDSWTRQEALKGCQVVLLASWKAPANDL